MNRKCLRFRKSSLRVSPVLLGVILALVGCGDGSQADSGTSSATDGPCALLDLAEVKRALPDAARAERDTSLDKYDIATCMWHGSKSSRLLMLQTWDGQGSTAEAELQSRLLGFRDPMRVVAGEKFQTEMLDGVGNAASVAVERADAQRGILANFALLVVRQGDRMILIEAQGLAVGDRAAAVAVLESLGRSAAGRVAGTGK
jgi:hypothetical protein